MQNEIEAARRINHLISTAWGLLDSIRRTADPHEELAAITDDRLMEIISLLGDMRYHVSKRREVLRMIDQAHEIANLQS
jgi:hypothetical protein